MFVAEWRCVCGIVYSGQTLEKETSVWQQRLRIFHAPNRHTHGMRCEDTRPWSPVSETAGGAVQEALLKSALSAKQYMNPSGYLILYQGGTDRGEARWNEREAEEI